MRLVKRLCLALLIAVAAAIVLTFVQAALLRWFDPGSTAWMRMRERQAHAERRKYTVHHTWVPLSAIPRRVQRAVIEAEDGKFYQHHGFDWEAIRAARARNERAERIKRGGSTITQQLAKNVYLSPSKNPLRKLRELFIARRLEAELKKARILELYLNVIEWGDGIYGVEAAARTYFHVTAAELGPTESAPAPSFAAAMTRSTRIRKSVYRPKMTSNCGG